MLRLFPRHSALLIKHVIWRQCLCCLFTGRHFFRFTAFRLSALCNSRTLRLCGVVFRLPLFCSPVFFFLLWGCLDLFFLLFRLGRVAFWGCLCPFIKGDRLIFGPAPSAGYNCPKHCRPYQSFCSPMFSVHLLSLPRKYHHSLQPLPPARPWKSI